VNTRPVLTQETPAGVVSIAAPVGAIVTDTGHTFAVHPVNPLAQPFRLRCTRCPWQATVTGLPELTGQARRHAAAHDLADSLPTIRPGWGWLARLGAGGVR
jgi:hypothetical protein